MGMEGKETAAGGVRRLVPACGGAITLIAAAWAADLPLRLGIVLFTEQALAAMLGLTLAIVFVTHRARRAAVTMPPWYDTLAAIAGFSASVYVAVRFPVLSNEFFYHPTETFLVGLILVPLVLEALRRAAGLTLPIIVLCFLLYALFGDMVPGMLEGRPKPFDDLMGYLAIDTSAIFGLPMRVISTMVVMFILVGQLLLHTGGSAWFTELSSALMGRSRGGAAKIAIVASSLFGTISGAAVSNVASTGVITIPLMRQAGYSAQMAGAVEAVASTGGQIMPPVMGAAAFLMAEFLEVPYTDVVLAALIPAILYYVAVFVLADLEAARLGIAPLPSHLIPRFVPVIRAGWSFIVPFAVLIVLLFEFHRTPAESALAAAACIAVLNATLGYKGRRLDFRTLWRAVWNAGELSASIIIIGAMAGIIIGVLEGTGLGFGLTFMLVQFGEGSMFALLLLTAFLCILLGMGMPTAGIYLLLATLAAPPLIKLGVEPMAAHLFVLYFGILSMITPPVALAAFTAANIAQTDPLRTGLTACRLGWAAFVVPFVFVLSPELLMYGHPVEVILAAITAIAGVWLASGGIMGYLLRPLSTIWRLLFVFAGISLLVPATAFPGALYLEFGGLTLGVLLMLREYLTIRRARAG